MTVGNENLKAGAVAVFVVGALLITAMATAGSLQNYPTTETAPSLGLQDLAKEFHRLEQYHGKVILVNFWGSWCPPCVEEMPALQRLEKKYQESDFVILAVNVNQTRTSVQRFIKAMALDMTILLDSSATTAKAWGVNYYPSSFIIDKNGSIRFYIIGTLEWEQDEVMKTLDSLIYE